jgi:hypothetical protein
MTPRVVVQTVATNDRRAYPAPVRNIDWMLWTPDEQSVFIDGTGQDNVQRMFKLDLASGRVEPASEARRVIIGVSPDGRFVFEIGAGLGIARRSLVDDTSVTLGPNPGNGTALSPDGHWVAYIGRGTRGEVPLAIRPVAGGAETVLVEKFSPGYARITWSRDSRFIVFNNNPAGLHRVSIDGGPPVSLGITGLGSIMEKSMNADGRRLAFGVNRDSTELWVWENVLTQGRRP